MGYKVETEDDIKSRKEVWEKGNMSGRGIEKKPVEEMGYKVDTEDDIKSRKENWEKGKMSFRGIEKKNPWKKWVIK